MDASSESRQANICSKDNFDKDIDKCSVNEEKQVESIASPEELPASLNPSNPGLEDLKCILETKELWNKFNDLGTEMIITKSGRFVYIDYYKIRIM